MGEGDVAAVVVTYNRRNLLQACMMALTRQTRPVDRIYLVDNASTDGTPDMLRELGMIDNPRLVYLRQDRNLGGAGGYYAGMSAAYRNGHDWLWLMDDDTEARLDCLERLLLAWNRHPDHRKPVMLASRVEWTDGNLHLMNRVALKHRGAQDDLWLAAGVGCIPLRSASFVSLLVRADAVGRHGLPIRRYFIWGDDMEWTARVLRREYGVGVPDSVAIHRTKANHTFMDAGPDRFALHVRNLLWTLMWSPSHSWGEKAGVAAGMIASTAQWLWRRRFHPACVWAVLKGFCLACCGRVRLEQAPTRADAS